MKKRRPKLPKEVLEFFRATGAQGGKERARRLTPQQRSEIAKKAVEAREAKKTAKTRLPKAEQKTGSRGKNA
jgi:hypothetical protein